MFQSIAKWQMLYPYFKDPRDDLGNYRPVKDKREPVDNLIRLAKGLQQGPSQEATREAKYL